MKSLYKYRGVISVFFAAVCLSFAGILIKMVDWPAIPSYGARSIFTFVTILIYLIKRKHKIYFDLKVFIGSLIFCFMNISFTVATQLTTAGNAIVLQFTMPIFIILFSWMILRKKPDKLEILCSIGVFIGMICFFIDQLTGKGIFGNIMGILSGVTYALVYMMKTLPGYDYDNSLLFSCLMGFILGLPFYGSLDWNLHNVIFIFLGGAIQTGVGFVLLSYGLELVSPITAALTSTVEPILNPFWVMLFLGEMLSPSAILGAGIVLITSLVYNVLSAKALNLKKT